MPDTPALQDTFGQPTVQRPGGASAINLYHGWTRQGAKAQGRQLLSKVYARFNESFDTSELQAARTLLGAGVSSAASRSVPQPIARRHLFDTALFYQFFQVCRDVALCPLAQPAR
jgi:hypothetical protein